MVDKFKLEKGISDATIDSWLIAEENYLDTIKSGPQHDELAMNYIEALKDLDAAE